MALRRKGIREIRSLSGRVDRVSLPYRAYLKISCLEMEKARRTREKESARESIARIDTRLEEIEAEKAALLRVLKDLARETDRENSASEMKETPEGGAGGLQAGGFKFRY
jgi:hypothetical protein